jgi:hypothetical protein
MSGRERGRKEGRKKGESKIYKSNFLQTILSLYEVELHMKYYCIVWKIPLW